MVSELFHGIGVFQNSKLWGAGTAMCVSSRGFSEELWGSGTAMCVSSRGFSEEFCELGVWALPPFMEGRNVVEIPGLFPSRDRVGMAVV